MSFFLLRYSWFIKFQVYSKVIQFYVCVYVCVCVCVCMYIFFFRLFSIIGYYKMLKYSSLCNIIGLSLSRLYIVQFSHSVVSNSLQPHGLQHVRLPCPSPVPGVYSDSCPSSWWYHQTILFSVVPFSSHFQSFPASGSFSMSQFFASSSQSIGVSASASVLPMNVQVDLL